MSMTPEDQAPFLAQLIITNDLAQYKESPQDLKDTLDKDSRFSYEAATLYFYAIQDLSLVFDILMKVAQRKITPEDLREVTPSEFLRKEHPNETKPD